MVNRRPKVRWSSPGEPGTVAVDWPEDMARCRPGPSTTHYRLDSQGVIREVDGSDSVGTPVGPLLRPQGHGIRALSHNDMFGRLRVAYRAARAAARKQKALV